MKRQCIEENITSTLNYLLYICVLGFYMYLFIYNVLLVCLYNFYIMYCKFVLVIRLGNYF